jgi:hypothetical protein
MQENAVADNFFQQQVAKYKIRRKQIRNQFT